jgi:hypothetical protein
LDARYNFAIKKVIDMPYNSKRSHLIQLTLGYKFEL